MAQDLDVQRDDGRNETVKIIIIIRERFYVKTGKESSWFLKMFSKGKTLEYSGDSFARFRWNLTPIINNNYLIKLQLNSKMDVNQ